MPPRKRPTKKASVAKPKLVSIRYADSEVPVAFANNYYINHDAHEFIVTLAQVIPPPVLHMTPEELAKLDHVDAKIVARFAMSPSLFDEFVRGAVDNYQTWLTNHGTSDEAKAK